MLLSRLLLVFSMDQFLYSSLSSWLFDHDDRGSPGQKFLLVSALLANTTGFTFFRKKKKEVVPQLWKFNKFIMFNASWVQL